LRRSQQQRIAAQRDPDGQAFTPRKPRRRAQLERLHAQPGRIRRHAMFGKLRTMRFLKMESDAQHLAIGFSGRTGRLARVHQSGESDQVALGGPGARYPARQLLGLTEVDRQQIIDQLLADLTRSLRKIWPGWAQGRFNGLISG